MEFLFFSKVAEISKNTKIIAYFYFFLYERRLQFTNIGQAALPISLHKNQLTIKTNKQTYKFIKTSYKLLTDFPVCCISIWSADKNYATTQ